jgi:hypothetical protein
MRALEGNPTLVNPAAKDSPYPVWLANSPNSEFAKQYGLATTNELSWAMERGLINTMANDHQLIPFLYNKPVEYVNSHEFYWREIGNQRPAIQSNGSAGGGATQTVTLRPGQTANIGINSIIAYPDNTKGIVTTVDRTANTIGVSAYTGGASLPAVVAGSELRIEKFQSATGGNYFVGYGQVEMNTFYNVVNTGQRAVRWSTDTALEYQNNGNVNRFEEDINAMMLEIKRDMFASFINGTMGLVDVTAPVGSSSIVGEATPSRQGDGMYNYMIKRGVRTASSTSTTIRGDMKAICGDRSPKSNAYPRIILSAPKNFLYIDDILKNPQQYRPADNKFSLNLTEYEFGASKFIKMPIASFEKSANLFPEFFENLIFIIDPNYVNPVCVKGKQTMTKFDTYAMHKKHGGYNDYVDYGVEYCVGLKMSQIESCAIINFNV